MPLTDPEPVTLSIPAGKESVCWFNDWTEVENPAVKLETPRIPEYVFRYDQGCISVTEGNQCIAAALSLPILGAYFADINDDGHPELCVYGSYCSGLWDEHVEVFDLWNRQRYILEDYGTYDYSLVTFDGEMRVQRAPYAWTIGQGAGETTIGRLVLNGDTLSIEPVAYALYD